jgi:methionyl-tRNA formyltransferase
MLNSVKAHEKVICISCARNAVQPIKHTSGFKLATRTVHLSLLPITPRGRTPPKASIIADALETGICEIHMQTKKH